MPSQRPKKPRQLRGKRFNISFKSRWQKLIKEVETKEIPIRVMQSLTVNLIDGSSIDIDIKELLEQGFEANDIEEYLEKKLNDLDHIIKDVDFYIDVDAVAKTIQPITDFTLKDL